MADISQITTRIASALSIKPEEAAAITARLLPVLLIDDLGQIGDSSDLATRYAWGGTQASASSLLPTARLQNPTGSGKRIVVEGTTFSATAATQIGAAIIAIDTSASTAATSFRDEGPITPAVPIALIEDTEVANIGANDIFFLMAANEPFSFLQWYSIDEGNQFVCQANQTADSFLVSWFWREIKTPTIV